MTAFDDDQLDELSRLLAVSPEVVKQGQLDGDAEPTLEKRLAVGVLHQAWLDIRECREPTLAPHFKEMADEHEVMDWWFSDTTEVRHVIETPDGDHVRFETLPADGPFSLRGVCELLGFQVTRVREAVHRWLTEHPHRSATEHAAVRSQRRNSLLRLHREAGVGAATLVTVSGLTISQAAELGLQEALFGKTSQRLRGISPAMRHFGLDRLPTRRKLRCIAEPYSVALRHFGLTPKRRKRGPYEKRALAGSQLLAAGLSRPCAYDEQPSA